MFAQMIAPFLSGQECPKSAGSRYFQKKNIYSISLGLLWLDGIHPIVQDHTVTQMLAWQQTWELNLASAGLPSAEQEGGSGGKHVFTTAGMMLIFFRHDCLRLPAGSSRYMFLQYQAQLTCWDEHHTPRCLRCLRYV